MIDDDEYVPVDVLASMLKDKLCLHCGLAFESHRFRRLKDKDGVPSFDSVCQDGDLPVWV